MRNIWKLWLSIIRFYSRTITQACRKVIFSFAFRWVQVLRFYLRQFPQLYTSSSVIFWFCILVHNLGVIKFMGASFPLQIAISYIVCMLIWLKKFCMRYLPSTANPQKQKQRKKNETRMKYYRTTWLSICLPVVCMFICLAQYKSPCIVVRITFACLLHIFLRTCAAKCLLVH